MKPRQPKHGQRISWARVQISEDRMQWRLFRRSEVTRRVFPEMRTFAVSTPRPLIANELRRMRARLRDAVDAYDLSLLGVSA